jgi:hypothetical protein
MKAGGLTYIVFCILFYMSLPYLYSQGILEYIYKIALLSNQFCSTVDYNSQKILSERDISV